MSNTDIRFIEFFSTHASECITIKYCVVMPMVRLLKKIKNSFAPLNKLRLTRHPNPLITTRPETEANTPETPIQPETTLAITSPIPVSNPQVSLDQPETLQTSVSTPVIMKRTPRVKISRIKHRVRRPQSVIRERGEDDVDDKENKTSGRVYIVSRKPILHKRKRKLGVVKPKFRIARA